jgi:hypothetical protein
MQSVVLWGCMMAETVLGAATNPSLNFLLPLGQIEQESIDVIIGGLLYSESLAAALSHASAAAAATVWAC